MLRRRGTFNVQNADLILNFNSVVSLFAGEREEAFEGERAIRLFQFRTWILFSDGDHADWVKWAGLIAAAKILESMGGDNLVGGNSAPRIWLDAINEPLQPPGAVNRQRKGKTRGSYDELIGEHGWVRALLHTPRPSEFDKAAHARIERMHIVADLIDYRLRYIQHRGDAQPSTGANHSHALFFYWWPTHEIQGTRGRTAPGKSVTTRTMGTWWGIFEGTALFIYLIQKHGFRQLPMDTNTAIFVDQLMREANDTGELLRFLGAYAYLVDAFRKADSELPYLPFRTRYLVSRF